MLVIRILLALIRLGPLREVPSSIISGDQHTVPCKLVAAGNLSTLRWSDFSRYKQQVQIFYQPTHYAFAWTHCGVATDQARAMIENFIHADDQGLDPDDYDGPRWATRLALIGQSGTLVSDLDLARLDLELTVSLMRCIADLHFGKANPAWFHYESASDPLGPDLGTFIRQNLVSAADTETVIASIEPPYQDYRQTKAASRRYLVLAGLDDKCPLPAPSKAVEPGHAYLAAGRLAARHDDSSECVHV